MLIVNEGYFAASRGLQVDIGILSRIPIEEFKGRIQNPKYFMYLLPAFAVHLWLLLFAVGALVLRAAYPFFRLVEWAQWFLRRGNQHPLRAIGVVAATLMFIVGVIWKTVAA